jgi:rSAM/selenodomain-associated transferase 2
MRVSIIIPVLNEGETLSAALSDLALNVQNESAEILIVDGGSSDNTIEIARRCATKFPENALRIIGAGRGRASQQNSGAGLASGEVLMFLHADTRLPHDGIRRAIDAFEGNESEWGRFDVRFDEEDVRMRVIAQMMNWRSRVTGVATGDQCIFVRRSAFFAAGGFPDQPLMEDIDLSTRLKQISKPICLRDRVTTSARRWRKHGVVRTVLLMWWIRFAHWLGVSPSTLARWYGYGVNRPK